MTYVSWAAFHEGRTDALYLEVLIPKLMEDIIAADGIRNSDIPQVPAIQLGTRGRAVKDVAAEICDAKDAFQVVFIHADTGGRCLNEGLDERSKSYCELAYEICEWSPIRCVTVMPRHETEAWVLADPFAVAGALGYSGDPMSLGLPKDAKDAERIPDPKAVLEKAMKAVSGSRRKRTGVDQLLPAIAQRQSISSLRGSESFRQFEVRLRRCLHDLGCIGGTS